MPNSSSPGCLNTNSCSKAATYAGTGLLAARAACSRMDELTVTAHKAFVTGALPEQRSTRFHYFIDAGSYCAITWQGGVGARMGREEKGQQLDD